MASAASASHGSRQCGRIRGLPIHDPDKIDLTSPFELYGEWWWAGADPDRRASGCLSYTPDHGLQLQLYGDLPSKGLAGSSRSGGDRPIWGEVAGAVGRRVPVALFHPIPTNRPNDPRAMKQPSSQVIYFINRALVGTHAIDPDSLHLASIRFSLSDLESFANTKPVAGSVNRDGIKLACTPVERPEELIEGPDVRASIRTIVEYNASLHHRNCTIAYLDEIALTPAAPVPSRELTDVVFSLTNFLHLCARESVEFRYVRWVLDSGVVVSSLGLMRQVPETARVRDWVLTLADLGGRLDGVLERWFVLAGKLRFVGPVFFGELASPSPVQDAKFFHFAGCLEAFHREVVQADSGKFMPRKDYREVAGALLDHLAPAAVPDGLRDAMRSALSRANDHSFAERIEALFNALEPQTQRRLAEERRRFLAAIKHSRNKLAHVTDESSGETFEGRELAHANLSIRAWLTILMLKECGVPESTIRERMDAIGYFYWGPFVFGSGKE